ncbi:MAG: hypothetical protein V1678_01470 [Candidatus Aenigmatarchaeota archaeon]
MTAGIDTEMMNFIGIGGLFSRKNFEKKSKEYLEKTGKVDEIKGYLKKDIRNELLREVPVGGDKYSTFDEQMEKYGITVEYNPSRPNEYSFLRADHKRVAVFTNGGIVPLGSKRDLENTFKIINKERESYGFDKLNLADLKTEQLQKERLEELEMTKEKMDEDSRQRIRERINEALPLLEVEKKKRLGIFPTYKVSFELEKGYEDLFKNMTIKTDKHFVYSMLKTMEKEADSTEKRLKMTGLKKLYAKNEKVNREKILSVAVLGIVGGAAATTALAYAMNDNGGDNNPFDNTPSSPSKKLHSLDPAVWSELSRNSHDLRVTNSSDFMSAASQDFLDWNVYGDANVLNPESGTYRQEPLTPKTIQFFGNYSLATQQLGLPKHNVADIQAVGNMTQNNDDIVNFNPIRLGGNSSYVDIVPVPSREGWSTVQQVKDIREGGYEVLDHPEMNLGLNTKVITNNWCLFDNKIGIHYYDNGITPSDSSVKELTDLQWDLYSQFAPIRGGKVYSDFSWWDSNNLRQSNPNENGLRAALFDLWQLVPATYSIKDHNIVPGIEGAKTSLLQAADEFSVIKGMYPNGNVQVNGVGLNPKFFYYGEMDDRFHNGMSKTISALVGGWDDSKVGHGGEWHGDAYDWIQNQNGPDQFVNRNWKSWDLAKFIIGYERFKQPEWENINHIAPNVLRVAGFPVNHVNISPDPIGGAVVEYSIGLPQNVAKDLQTIFPNENILLGPGYTFGINSMGDGLKKDGMKEAYVLVGDKSVYIMK